MARGGGAAADLPAIEGYRVIEEIGEGGFSRVYRAHQNRIGRDVAVKVLNKGFADDDERAAFFQECKVMGQLTHPNIVNVIDSGTTTDGRGCIMMELYAGTFDTVGRMSIAEVVNAGIKVAEALDEAHRKDVVHHDLKPQNLFVSSQGDPVLGDFGISTIAGRQTGRTRLTLKYAPPELLRDSRSDALGDIYSLGVTLFQMAAGEVPFDAATDEELITTIMVEPPPRLPRADAPASLDLVLRRCLAKRPEDRPQTAAELVDELRRIQSVVGVPLRSRTSAPSSERLLGRESGPKPVREDGTLDDVDLGRASAAEHRSPSERSGRAAPEPPPPAPPNTRRTQILIVAAVAVLAVAGLVIALAGGGDGDATPDDTSSESPTPTTVAAEFVVLTPPTGLTVVESSDGFEFTWTPSNPTDRVQLHRVGTDDNVIADESPFVWALEAVESGSCFEARAVNAEGSRLSQGTAGPVCA